MAWRQSNYRLPTAGCLSVLGGIVCLTLAGCGQHKEPAADKAQKPAEMSVIKTAVFRIEPSGWPTIVKTQGSLTADEVTVVGAKVAGRVADVFVDLGDVATANDTLATLEQEEFKLQVALAEAQLTQARAALGLSPDDPVDKLNPVNAPPVREARAVLDEIEARVARLQQLRQKNAVTQDELALALSSQGVADARYAAALNGVREKIALIHVRAAELSVAQEQLANTTIVAPFDGLVFERHVARGTFLQAGDPVVTLVRTKTLRFRGQMPERHAHRLAIGQQVTLHFESSIEPTVAHITRISPVVDEQTRALAFEAAVDNAAGNLRTGLFAEAEVVVDPGAQSLAIPQGAVHEFAGVEKVWKIVDGVAQEQVIQTARRDPEAVEVVGGLAAGDTILTDATQGEVARVEPTTTSGPASFRTLVAKPPLPSAPDDSVELPADSPDSDSSREAE
jgi:RND family efflux transporter MFP subunit